LRNRNDRWRIIDVVIEGISLVSNFRSQFAEVLNSGSIEDLLAKLREKNTTPILDDPKTTS
jgi:phospholipid transport system substrate-binding protein